MNLDALETGLWVQNACSEFGIPWSKPRVGMLKVALVAATVKCE